MMEENVNNKRLINHMIIINLKESNDFLLVNGLNGAVDIFCNEEKQIIDLWRKTQRFEIKNEREENLFKMLDKRRYIMSEQEERDLFNKVVTMLHDRVNIQETANSAWFVLTYNCNFNCPYCYENKEGTKVLTKDMVDKIFDINPNLKKIGFFGGEPLLPENKEIIEYIIEKANQNATFYVITNGYYLEEYVNTLSKVNIGNIQVTLDGTEDMHNRTRCTKDGQPTYNKIMSGIKVCTQSDIPVTIRMNISKNNMESCLEERRIINSYDWGQNIQFELQSLFQLGNDDSSYIYSNIMNDEQGTEKTNKLFEKLMPISEFLYNKTPLYPIVKACDREGQTRFYDVNGNIYNCILAVGNIEKSIGKYYPQLNLKDKSFLTRDITKIEKCKSCENALFCGGGCPNAIPSGCDIYSPNCASFLNDINYTVPIIYKQLYGENK